MQKIRARRYAQRITSGGTDEVLVGWSLPSDTIVHSVRGRVSAQSSVSQALLESFICMVEGYVLPVLDVDAEVSFDTLWDNLVPKDTDVQLMDLDTAAADTTAFSEPGEIDWASLLDVGLRPKKVYGRENLVTFPTSPTGFNITSADVLKYVPAATFNLGLDTGPFRVSQPSVLLFALGSPVMDDTTTVVEKAAKEDEWGRHKYITQVVQDAMKVLFGLTQAGAEVPWQNAIDLIQKLLEPDVMEETVGSWGSAAWVSFSNAVMTYSVRGTFEQLTLSSGR